MKYTAHDHIYQFYAAIICTNQNVQTFVVFIQIEFIYATTF